MNINRIAVTVGHGYTLSMVQLAGDHSFMECCLFAPDGELIKFGPNTDNIGCSHDDEQAEWRYVSASKLADIIHGAIAKAEFLNALDSLNFECDTLDLLTINMD